MEKLKSKGSLLSRGSSGYLDRSNSSAELVQDIDSASVSLRHKLHRHPETSGRETLTASTIIEFLKKYDISPIAVAVGGLGLLYKLEGTGESKATAVPTLLFRAEMDAMPLQERTSHRWKSQEDRKHHAMGHDGHCAMLAGALATLKDRSSTWTGTVYALFQPSKMTAKGASLCLDHEIFKSLEIKRTFAIHNVPNMPFGQLSMRSGSATSASCGVEVVLLGAISHVSQPEKGRNPLASLARIALNILALPDVARVSGAAATLVQMDAGAQLYSVSAGAGCIRAVVRAETGKGLDTLLSHVHQFARQEADALNLKAGVTMHERYPAVVNDDEAVHFVEQAVTGLCTVAPQQNAFAFSDDFSYFTTKYGGALIGLGAGDQPDFATGEYDFNDKLVPLGIRVWVRLVEYNQKLAQL